MTNAATHTGVANENELNRDPISGTPGAHPVGTGAGAASGGVAGAAVGLAVAGPVGGVIGAAVGAVAGGLAGKGAAEAINPTHEEPFWRVTDVQEPYYATDWTYEHYAPGFRAGWEARVRHDGRTFDEVESELMLDYNVNRTALEPSWQQIKPAARATWDRVDGNWKGKEQ